MVDEVNTGSLLTQMRHFKLGALLAHQGIKDQLTDAIFSTISANTRIKFAATRFKDDAAAMSKSMRCEPEFILDQKKVGSKLHFACFCDGVTPHPFSYELDANINNFPVMNDSWYEVLVEFQRREYEATQNPPEDGLSAPDDAPPPENLHDTRPPTHAEEKPKMAPPARQPTAPPAISKPAADPHSGAHTEPASNVKKFQKFFAYA